MTKLSSPRLFRAAVGLAAVGAFAVAPVAAHAGNTDADGTLTSGGLALATPAISTFSRPLTGLTQVVPAQVGAWSVTDATGSNAGYSVTVAASSPTVNGVVADAGTDPSLQLTPTTATPATNNPAGMVTPLAISRRRSRSRARARRPRTVASDTRSCSAAASYVKPSR